VTANPIDSKHPQSKKDAPTQLRDAENCLDLVEQG